MRPFKNRSEAGKFLGLKLSKQKWTNTCVLALPRGGVPVGIEVAKILNLPWDVLIVKKIGAPNQPEYAIGALPEDNIPVWNPEALGLLNLGVEQLSTLCEKTHQKVKAQLEQWRRGEPCCDLKNKNVILVDDGLATGLTMRAAVALLRRKKVGSITIAIPVAPLSAIRFFSGRVTQVVALTVPSTFSAVGEWYDDFTQLKDETVTQLLDARSPRTTNSPVSGPETDDFGSSMISIPIAGDRVLLGELHTPSNPTGLIVFAHGSGSSRLSPRNQWVAKRLNKIGFATFLFDLLTPQEAGSRRSIFEVDSLSDRLILATEYLRRKALFETLPVAYFGSSTGAAAALIAAAKDPTIATVVSRGGRPDLAASALSLVSCPVLLLVGGADSEVLSLNRWAKRQIPKASLEVIANATHLFEEPGALEQVVQHTEDWFRQFLRPTPSRSWPEIPLEAKS